MKCRHCASEAMHMFLDLGHQPPSNSYISEQDHSSSEIYLPLRVRICESCWLAQTEDYTTRETFFSEDYAYFSSASEGWLRHAKTYCDEVKARLGLGADSFVVEIASNDGYLLKNFVEAGVPCLGVEPTKSTAEAAISIGVPTLVEFFGEALGRRLKNEKQAADLICGNNVFAHVPDINDFVRGVAALLATNGTVNFEFPHLLKLLEFNQFDTVYHEHYSYLSLTAVKAIFEASGLRLYDVQELPTHGGSLRVFGCLKEADIAETPAVQAMLNLEQDQGLTDLKVYQQFQSKADKIKNDFVRFLIRAKNEGKRVMCYGAAAKGNTLMNYGGVKQDLIHSVCDRAKSKQNKRMPGSHLPIVHPDQLAVVKPDYVVILPWNIADEIHTQQGATIARWGGKFVCAVPELKVY